MTARTRIAARGATLAVGASLIAALLPAGTQAATLFGAYQAVAVPFEPDAVAIADVTGDGRNDIVTTSGYSGNAAVDFKLVILAGRADGGLDAPAYYATAGTYPARPGSLAIGDITGDGRNDVVIGNDRSSIQVFPQTAGGTLGTPATIVTTDSTRVEVGHLAGDAGLDVVGIGWGSNTATIFQNVAGSLVAQPALSVKHGGYDDLEVADVSGDGLDDIVVMSGQLYADPNISVLAQLPAGGFAAAATYSVGTNILTQGIGVGDVTGDGRNDVVTSYGGNSPYARIGVFAGQAGGLLAPLTAYSSYDIPEPVEVADVNADGRADVVTLHGGWLKAGVYLGQAGGTLAAEQLFAIPYATHYNPQGLAIGDVNNDGAVDIVAADYNNGIVILPGAALPKAPGAPTLTSATPASGSVSLSWAAPSSNGGSPITSYRVTAAPGGATCTTSGALGCTISGLANGTSYSFTVTATNAIGTSPASNALSATPVGLASAPRSLKAVAGKKSVSLSWAAPASNGGSAVTSYRIYRGSSSGKEVLLVTVPATTTSFVDAGLSTRSTWWYVVTAVTTVGESARSNEVSATAK